ncbi:fused MFS/spermidine synthase, partial [Phreatobacter sp. AB_2022a]
ITAAFGGAVFTSAALLFAVQPLFAKMVLPRLGGSPGVWSVAMVFFQAMLLGGYAYAHVLTTCLRPRAAVAVHIAVLAAASLALPLGMAGGWGRPPANGETLWLIGLFTASIGLPFFVLSANGPLLQAWFARTHYGQGRNPYWLYAASNVGSFLALLSYPFLVEPLTTLGLQVTAWSQGFYLLIALVAFCGALLVQLPAAETGESAGLTEVGTGAAPEFRAIAGWVGFAFVPSALMVAVTAYLSTDVAAAPFMWVLPLGLFLLTFVLVFQDRELVSHRFLLMLQPFLLIMVVLTLTAQTAISALGPVVLLHLAAFFVTAMVCHGELARRRPAPRHLTAFYLWMSFGGMLGGIFTGLLAPHLFSWVAEYPLLLGLAVLCRPGASWQAFKADRVAQGLAAAGAALVLAGVAGVPAWPMLAAAAVLLMRGLLIGAILWRNRPFRLMLLMMLAVGIMRVFDGGTGETHTTRSFFGVHRISVTDDGRFKQLAHGTTVHGIERIAATGRPEPLSYYHAAGPLGQAIAATRERLGRPIRVAVVGLGSGSLACYAVPGDAWRFYEIDAEIERIARTEFSFLRQCAPEAPIILGDARLTLADGEQGAADLIIIDAFSSDSIPSHLLTAEALAVYRRKLAPGGLVALHVSNRHMELSPAVAATAAAQGLAARGIAYVSPPEAVEAKRFSATVVVVAEQADSFGRLDAAHGWQPVRSDARPWTDDYSNIVGAIIARYWR